MIELILVFLFISQIVTFYFLLTNKKIILKEKVEGIVLKDLPKDAKFKDAQPDYQIVYDVFKSIKLENWKIKIDEDSNWNDKKWEIHSNSNDGAIRIMCRIRMYNTNPESVLNRKIKIKISNFIITTNTDSLSFGENDTISNDILLFFWDYIIKEKESYNDEVVRSYQSSIDNISSKLKTLKRSERLQSILENESN